MFTLFRTSSFKADFKKLSESDKEKLKSVLERLINGEPLESKHKLHSLTGNYHGSLECHVKPDLLLIFKIDNELQLVRIGSHSQLFKK